MARLAASDGSNAGAKTRAEMNNGKKRGGVMIFGLRFGCAISRVYYGHSGS